MVENELIRPSSLSALAHCRCYKGSYTNCSTAATRGTAIDMAIRLVMAGRPMPSLDPLDRDAVEWGCSELRRLAEGRTVYTDEQYCRVHIPALHVKAGTMDAYCPELYWLADIKTGQIRDYAPQMAAYALGMMDAYQTASWTAYVVFVDARKTLTYIFTREQAANIVSSIVNAPLEPTLCEYCDWCAKVWTCDALNKAAQEVMSADPDTLLDRLQRDNTLAADWLTAFARLGKLADKLKLSVRHKLESGQELDRFKLSSAPTIRSVSKGALRLLTERAGADYLLDLVGSVRAEKIAELWQQTFDAPIPEELIATSYGASRLIIKKNK